MFEDPNGTLNLKVVMLVCLWYTCGMLVECLWNACDFVGFQSFVLTIFDSGGALFTRGAMTEQGKSHGLQKLHAWKKCHNREMMFCHLWCSNVTNQE